MSADDTTTTAAPPGPSPDLAEAEQHARTLAAMPPPIGLPFAVLMAEYERRGSALAALHSNADDDTESYLRLGEALDRVRDERDSLEEELRAARSEVDRLERPLRAQVDGMTIGSNSLIVDKALAVAVLAELDRLREQRDAVLRLHNEAQREVAGELVSDCVWSPPST